MDNRKYTPDWYAPRRAPRLPIDASDKFWADPTGARANTFWRYWTLNERTA